MKETVEQPALPVESPKTTQPFVTVVMPLRNESKFVERSLKGVVDQDYPAHLMEVIVVDGRSDDNTREVIQQIIHDRDQNLSKPSPNVRIIDNPQKIVPTGLNAAIRMSQGKYVIRVDGHTILEPDYVRQCVEVLERTGVENVGGMMNAVGDDYTGSAIAIGTSTPFGIGNSAFHYSEKEQFVDTVYMGAFRKQVLFDVGLFDERFVRHQDYELNYRIRKHGGKIFLSPKIRSRYYPRNSLLTLWKQYFQYGYWKGQIMKYHPDSIRWRHTVPPLFVLSLFLMSLAAFVSKVAWLPLLILVPYFAFLVIATVVTAAKPGNLKYAFILPVIFAILHISYGSGVWLGILSRGLSKPALGNSVVNTT
jgi:succinoglycan biosynthesis protein ExoA